MSRALNLIFLFFIENDKPPFVDYLLLNIIAAITPGIQPAQVNKIVNKTAPQPLSKTASGGNIMHKIARPQNPIFVPRFVTI